MKILVLAMGRSGHHAIIKWIATNIGDTLFYNNCKNKWEDRRLKEQKVVKYGEGNDLRRFHTIKSIEDFQLSLWQDYKMEEWEKFDSIVIVHRSPVNWLASSIAAKGWANDYLDVPPLKEPELKTNRIQAYEQYIDNFKHRKYVKKCIDVLYDRWVDRENYRKTIAEKIGFNMDVSMVTHCKFSSFGRKTGFNVRYSLLTPNQKNRLKKLTTSKMKQFEKVFK